jgi:hypothetical protein
MINKILYIYTAYIQHLPFLHVNTLLSMRMLQKEKKKNTGKLKKWWAWKEKKRKIVEENFRKGKKKFKN